MRQKQSDYNYCITSMGYWRTEAQTGALTAPPPSFSKKSIERGTTSVTVIKEMWFMVEGMWYCQCAGIQDTTNLFSDSISSNETRSNILQCKEITCVPVIKSIVMDINGTWLFGRLSIMFHEMDTKFVFTNRVAYI